MAWRFGMLTSNKTQRNCLCYNSPYKRLSCHITYLSYRLVQVPFKSAILQFSISAQIGDIGILDTYTINKI